jgi:exonuclease VII large subunit
MIETSTLLKFSIKEPTEREFNRFKKEFLQRCASKYYDSTSQAEIRSLMRLCGQYQAEIDRLEHLNKKLSKQYVPKHGYLKTEKNRNVLKHYASCLLNDTLFLELKTGQLYA